MKMIGRIAGAIAILLAGPTFGILVAFFLAALALPPDPNFDGHAAPGDGFLIFRFLIFSLAVSIPLSIAGAGLVLFWSGDTARNQTNSAGSETVLH
jgi:hypothetical protein